MSYGSGIAIGDTLSSALAKVFTTSSVVPPAPTPGTPGTGTAQTDLDKALAAAQQAINDSAAALKIGGLRGVRSGAEGVWPRL